MRNKIPKLIFPWTPEIAEREQEKARKFQRRLIEIDGRERKIQQETWAAQEMEDFINKIRG